MKIIRIIVFLMMCIIMAACGSSGGKDDATPVPTTNPSAPSYNFTGIVYGESGAPLPGVTIYVFSPAYTTVTDAKGAYSLTVSKAEHTMMSSRSGTLDVFRLFNLSSGGSITQPIMLYNSAVSPVNVIAKNASALTSNKIGEYAAKLDIPAQTSGKFTVAGQKVDSVDISFEYLDNSKPFSVPLPSPNTLNPEDVIIGGKQSPSVMVAIKPALLSLDSQAELKLPNPHNLKTERILRFDAENHRWVKTNYNANTSPISITQGGVYGIFFEERKTGTVKGTAPAGSLVFAGDEIITVPSDGNFSAVVTVPPEGTVNLLNLVINSTDSSKNTVTPSSVKFDTSVSDQVLTVSFVEVVDVTVKTVTVGTGSDSVVADGTSTVAVTATVTDTNEQAVEGVAVSFSTSSGTISPATTTTKGGIASATLTSSLDTGTVTITASAKGVYGKKTITFLPRPKKLELSLTKADGTSGFSVKSDNSDYINVTATVLNSNNAPYADLGITFKIVEDPTFHQSGQMIALDSTGIPYDPATIRTDKYGKAVIRFSSGVSEKANRTVNITAETGGLFNSIPIQVTGTGITLSNDKSNLSSDKTDDKATLIIAVKDAGGNAIYNADVTASVISGDSSDPTSQPGWVTLASGGQSDINGVLTAKTDIKGELKLAVTGKTIGKTTVKVEALGDSKIQVYSVTSESETFAITDPLTDPTSLKTNTLLPIKVRASKRKTVVFSTTFGYWDNQLTKQVSEVSVDSDGYARASLRSPNAGLANVQIYYKDEPAISDTMQVAIYVPSDEAAQIALQASNTVISPRTSTVQNSITLTATVKNAQNQVVRNVPVAFSLDGTTTTGGGEYISPTVVYTNDLGVAETQFYSGYLSSRSSGVTIQAAALAGTAAPATVSVIIGGTATSIIIGASTLVTATNTTYTLPMSAQVVDSKGNPVTNTKVTLGIWPTRYRTGYWTTQPCKPVILSEINNEDADRDTIFDTGEDVNKDGTLTPPSSAAGEVPSFVQTGVTGSDSPGSVNFNLVYLKSSAIWIEAEVTATAVVLGTETKSVYTFWLPALKTDADACLLPDSPYNPRTLPGGKIIINSEPNALLCNGTSKSTVSARLTDYNGSPVANVLLTFTLSGSGGFPYANTISSLTNSDGIAVAEYQAPLKTSGTVTIKASGIDPYSNQNVEESTTIRLGTGSLQMQALPSELSANGVASSTISATVLDTFGNIFTSAEPVLFSIESGGGSLSGRTINTGSGSASVVYTAGKTSGTVTIKAELVNTGATATIPITLIGDSGVGFIELLANPISIKADGATSSKITATITDSSGNPVLVGTSVVFKTSAGTFQNGTSTYSLATPDNTGVVIVSLISGYSAETATITCTTGGITQSTTVTFTGSSTEPNAKPAYLQPAPTRNSDGNIACYNSSGQSGTCGTDYPIANYPYPKTINVRGTPGNIASKVAFTVYDTKGKPMASTADKKIRIDFQIISGPGGGEVLLTPFDYPNSNGEVSTLVRSGLKSGPVIVRAVYYADKSVSATSGQIAIGGGYPTGEGFSLSAEYLNIVGLSYAGLENTITARLADEYGNNVSDGTIVSFKTYNTGGYMTPPGVSTSSASPGAVSSKLISTGSPAPEAGYVSVTAETVNGALSTRITSLAVVHESESNKILYAGTNGGGIYKSTNSGQTWTNISRSSTIVGQNRINPYINDVVVDPYNRNIVYAATGFHGSGNIYRSVDGGQNWNSNEPSQFHGIFPINAAMLALAVDDDPNASDNSAPRLWVGTDGMGIYTLDWNQITATGEFKQKYWWKASGDALTNYVNDIVKAKGTYGDNAILYAGTAIGVYKSTDGGSTWNNKNAPPFVGYYITKLAVHPRNGNIVYAGTKDGSVWLSIDAGNSWSQYIQGFGKGVFATYPQAKVPNESEPDLTYNQGNGNVSIVNVLKNAKNETWTLQYSGSSFKATGSVSGLQSQQCTAGQKCTIPNMLEITISKGTVDFEDGDTFTFETVIDDGRYIKDLMVDAKNNRLYALTYFKSDVASHATGGVYVHDLTSNGDMAYTDWQEVSTGLKTYASTSASTDLTDTSLLANHALASDDPSNENPTTLYLGGEGINFYRASLSTGQVTTWQTSNTGLSNLIMARIPILFSGITGLCVTNGYYVTAMDSNGNPPAIGSKIVVTPPSGSTQPAVTYTYADGLYNQVYGPVIAGSTIVYTPACSSTTTAPGCSGSSITCIAGSTCEVCQ